MSPVFARQVYANLVTPALLHELDLEQPYDRIYVKVAFTGDNSVITGIRIGTSNSFSVQYEWKQQGYW